MDDPTRRCENDTGIETRLPGLPIPSGGPIFLPMRSFFRIRSWQPFFCRKFLAPRRLKCSSETQT